MAASQLKKSFKVAKKIESFYSGGRVLVSHDSTFLICTHNDKINIVDLETGQIKRTLDLVPHINASLTSPLA